MNRFLLTLFVFLMVGCSNSSEEPALDLILPIEQRNLAEIAGKKTEIAFRQGFRVETNDPDQLAKLNGGEEAVSVWLLSGEKPIGNITTVNENGNLRIMLFRSGFISEQEIEYMEVIFRDEFE